MAPDLQSAVSRQVHAGGTRGHAVAGARLPLDLADARGREAVPAWPTTSCGSCRRSSARSTRPWPHNPCGSRPASVSRACGLVPRLKHFQSLRPVGRSAHSSAHNGCSTCGARARPSIRYILSPAFAPPGSTRLFGHSIAPGRPIRRWASPTVPRPTRFVHARALLEYDDATYPWLQWSASLVLAGWNQPARGASSTSTSTIRSSSAAVDGQGVALGRLELIQPLLADGRLEQVGPARRSDVSDHA